MKNPVKLFVLSLALSAFGVVSAEEPPAQAVRLRFDLARTEQLADLPTLAAGDSAASHYPFAFKLNRRRVSEAVAYDAVTLWNVRRLKIKERRMRLADSTGREQVCLLKFSIEKDRKKGARPHLLGNVGGVRWFWQKKGRNKGWCVDSYTLRRDYDSLRRATGAVTVSKVPEELWRKLPSDAVYILDGKPVPAGVFKLMDGLILRTFDVFIGEQARKRGYDTPVVIGDTYPDRIPLVIFNGAPSSIADWVDMGLAGAFAMNAAVPMHYYYMLPVEAAQIYGMSGKYGAIVLDISN